MNRRVRSGRRLPMGTEVELKKQAGALATMDYGEATGLGYENQSADDYSTPFLRVLQPTSPAVVDGIAGAKPGAIINVATSSIFDDLLFVIGTTEQRWNEWKKRGEEGSTAGGSGFVASYTK